MLALMAEREQFRSLSAAKVQKVFELWRIRTEKCNEMRAQVLQFVTCARLFLSAEHQYDAKR